MARKTILAGFAAWACLGMVCVGPEKTGPSLPEALLQDIHLTLFDPEEGRAAAALSWAWPAGEEVSYFEIYQSLRLDSLLASPIMTQPPESASALVRLPDMNRSGTLYYGVRAVRVEPTGQKVFGRKVPADSLTVNPSLEILSPGSRTLLSGRLVEVEVLTSSDNGVVLRQSLFERNPGGWNLMLDTCLPMAACGTAVFGRSQQRDALTLPPVTSGDTLQSLYCVHGNESFENILTGRTQSLGCTRFFRVGP